MTDLCLTFLPQNLPISAKNMYFCLRNTKKLADKWNISPLHNLQKNLE